MKRAVFCFFIFHLSSFIVSSASAQWTSIPNVLPVSEYAALAYADGVLWAGGDALVTSVDNGRTWTNVAAFPGRAVKDISFCDKLHGVIGTEGALYLTSDGGTTWTSRYVDKNNFKFVQVWRGDDRSSPGASGRLIYALNYDGSDF